MSSDTIYLITGANRGTSPSLPLFYISHDRLQSATQSLKDSSPTKLTGIGLGLTHTLLLRPNTTVIATIRSLSTSTTALSALPKAETSTLLILPLSSSDLASYPFLLSSLSSNGISHIDILIANAGSGTSFHPILTTPPSALLEDFQTNTLGPILLYQTLFPLLKKSYTAKGKEAKFVLISSSLGSIGEMEGDVPCLSYGVSKAGANFMVRKVHFEEEGIVSLAVHPG